MSSSEVETGMIALQPKQLAILAMLKDVEQAYNELKGF